jgi:hypothetical protein
MSTREGPDYGGKAREGPAEAGGGRYARSRCDGFTVGAADALRKLRRFTRGQALAGPLAQRTARRGHDGRRSAAPR